MATRQSVHDFLQSCDDTIRSAQEQVNIYRKQEHYNYTEYFEAQKSLEEAVNNLAHLALSCTDEQRDLLHRKRLQLQQLQNDMTLNYDVLRDY